MPELPEVETVRKTLLHLVRGKAIQDVSVFWENIIKRPDDPEAFKHKLLGQTIQDIKRKGKFLIFIMDDVTMVSHLRMEGKFRVSDRQDDLPKHTHVIFHFSDNTDLRYNDVRKFGTMHLFVKGEEWENKPLRQLGPDPFDEAYTEPYFYDKLQKTSRSIKSVLLDQSVVAGLGNIYVDETLHLARIHPERVAHTLTVEESARVRAASIKIISNAVEQGGTTIRSYLNSQGEMGMFQQELKVYGKENTSCQACGETLVKIKVAGRGTHLCPTCQH